MSANVEWKQINDSLATAYHCRVPQYDLKPVLDLISGLAPEDIAEAAAESLAMMLDSIMTGTRTNNVRMQNIAFTLKAIYHAFSGVVYDRKKHFEAIGDMIAHDEGLYASEPMIDYPRS